MVSFKTSGLRLLRAATLITGISARCTPCSGSDKLLVLLRAHESFVAPFCAAVLGIPTSTVQVTATVTPETLTPTIVASTTSTVIVTETSTFFEEIITVTEAATVPAPSKKAKRSIDYPEWLPSTFLPVRISSACQCLSIVPTATTVSITVSETATAEPVTVTEGATVTETATTTLTTIGIVTVTQTATPTPSPVTLQAKIAVHRKSTGDRVGYVYLSSGPAITADAARGSTVKITVPGGSATQLRIVPDEDPTLALGFNVPASQDLQYFYGGLVADTPTPPGSLPVTKGANAYETDIFTLNTETNMIGWQWVNKDGFISSDPGLTLYRSGGRMYPVGNVNVFNSATGGVSSAKYEIYLKLEAVPV
ncbi:hypothetical protein QBC35DRAFT_545952 [Podospora australis]|uniref:Uncharacterized protein n=1 Tax=Podospora australis TaxID=1536484 RepID=A0AAN6WK86_9PEZI|nr:hypothetical protein QBC35DRAFT_545952 [Podospora australis]